MVDFSCLQNAHIADSSISWRMQYQTLRVGLEIKGESEQTLTIGPEEIQLSNGLEKQIDFKLIADKDA